MKVNFLPLKAEYLESVLEIEKLSFPNPWNRKMFEQELELKISHFFVAKQNSIIVGYGGFWKIEYEAHLMNLAVHPDFRNKGYGRRILHYICTQIDCTNITKILLEVRKSNEAAIKLYESEGFSISGIRPKYYGSEDAILMERELVKKTAF